ncbi:hypothetical protein [Escherichia coli]|uniref:hypothetical protein n=1 Tax=Escherichia coli TaxID=562 RepID=UPI000DF3FBBE|nr:hypothetical protein [Escherichia coli]
MERQRNEPREGNQRRLWGDSGGPDLKSQRQADNQGLRVNVLTMIVYPALLFCRLKIPCGFLRPDLQTYRAESVPAARLAQHDTVARYPHNQLASTSKVYDHHTTAHLS